MPKFYSFLQKNKTLIAAILLLVFVGLAIPHQAHAILGLGKLMDAIKSGLANLAGMLLSAFVLAITIAPLIASGLLALISSTLLRWVAYITMSGISFTKNPAVNLGWPMVRNLANMVIVLGFVIIGIATSLRIREYEAKKLLPKLIIAALLVNFSLLICGVIIDGSNILTAYFLKGEGGNTSNFVDTSALSNIMNLVKSLPPNPAEFAARIVGLIFFNLMSAIILILFVFLFLFRIVALWALVIFSPLAFVFSVFPATQSFSKMWWKNFIQWAFVSVPASFFMYLAAGTISSMAKNDPALQLPADTGLLQSMTSLFTFLMPGFFLIIGLLFSLQFSAMGAGGVRWAGNKAKMGGLAMGKALGRTTGTQIQNVSGKLGQAMQGLGSNSNNAAIRGIGKGLDKTLGGAFRQIGKGPETFQKYRSALGRGLEAAGGAPIGAQAAKDSARIEGLAKNYTKAYTSGNEQDRLRVEDVAKHGTGMDRAAAVAAIAGEKSLHKVFKNAAGDTDVGAIDEALQHYEEFGGAKNLRKDAQKLMPELSKFNKKDIEEIMAKINPATGANYTKAEAEAENKRKIIAGLSVPEMRAMPAKEKNADFYEHSNLQTLERASLEFTTEDKEESQKAVPELKARRCAVLGVSQTQYDNNYNSHAIAQDYKSFNPTQRGVMMNSWSANEKAAVKAATQGVTAGTDEYANAVGNAIASTRLAQKPKDVQNKVQDLNQKIWTINNFNKK